MIKNFRGFSEEGLDDSMTVVSLLTIEQRKWIADNVTNSSSKWSVGSNGLINVIGSIDCSDTGITDLRGISGLIEKIWGNFDCYGCKELVSIEGGPLYVTGQFDCSGCLKLESLRGGPQHIGGSIYIDGCTKLPAKEIEIAKDKELFLMWMKSGLDIEEFYVKKRGTIRGRKYGI
jgi:hypothetical protein